MNHSASQRTRQLEFVAQKLSTQAMDSAFTDLQNSSDAKLGSVSRSETISEKELEKQTPR